MEIYNLMDIFKMENIRKNLKLRHFRLIEVLAETKNIRRTADRLNITPGAVSKSCLEIENILKTKLFIRKYGSLVPNKICERFIIAGRRINAELKHLMTDLGTHEEGFYGRVKIGFQTPMLQDFIIRGVSEIKKMHPNLNLTLNYAARPELLAGLEANFYDFIFVNLTNIKSYSRFKILSLGTEQYIVATMKKIFSIPDVLEKWHEFSSFIWVLPVAGLAMRDRFESALAARGLALPSRLIEMNSPIGGEQIIALTDAYTLLPLTMIRNLGWPIDSSDVSLRFLPEMQLENGIVWLNDTELSAAAKYVRQLIVNKINKNIEL